MRWIRATLDRRRLRKQIQAGAPDWSLAHRVWGYAHQVNRGLIGPGARSTVELEAVEALAAMAPDAEARFESLLHDPNPCVCGYALLGLYRLQSSLLLQLPGTLFEREDVLVWQLGCFATEEPLGTFAETIRQDHEANEELRARPSMTVQLDEKGWVKCPFCSQRFKLTDPAAYWDGRCLACLAKLEAPQEWPLGEGD